MTQSERDFARAATMAAGLMAAGLVVGVALVSVLAAWNWGLALAGLRRSHRYAQLGFWGMSGALGSVIGAALIGSVALDVIKNKGWRTILMPAFIWPQKSSPNPTIAARMGRVTHWTFVLFAVCALLAGLYAAKSASEYREKEIVAQAEWDRAHPVPGRPGFSYQSVENEFGTRDYRPIVPSADDQSVLFGFIGAFFLALIGRGLRYILAGE